MKKLILASLLLIATNAHAAEVAELSGAGQALETAEDRAEQIGFEEATMTFDPSDDDQRESAIAPGVDCSGESDMLGIDAYDPVTRTFEIFDPMCEGQGPFYSTAVAIGEAVPVLWMKTDPKFFLNQSFRLSKPLEFHPTPELAMEERDLLKGNSRQHRIQRAHPSLRPQSRPLKNGSPAKGMDQRPPQSPMKKKN